MKDPYLLHIFSPNKNVSPFDINMAYEARYDAVIPYSNVGLEDTAGLTQDTIFSRGPSGVRRTAIFIGGRDLTLALDMLEAARQAMVPPFEVSVFTDPSGAITTAAAVVATVARAVAELGAGSLAGKRIHILGGTGPVGTCCGLLAAQAGADTCLVSHQGLGAAQKIADDCNRRHGTRLRGADGSSPAALDTLLVDAEILINAAKAGVRVLDRAQLGRAASLLVAADVNAVPPSGIEGVSARDDGVRLEGTARAVSLGALVIGDIKFKTHTRLLQMMYDAQQPLYLSHREAYAVALGYTGA
jgi:methylene-tetrahydromethanopterin dehydrogenase